MNKSKLFLFGGCDLRDIAESDILMRDFDVINYSVYQNQIIDNGSFNFENCSYPSMGTSLISLYTKPGIIAQRVLETFVNSDKRNLILNRQAYNEILKFPYLDFFKKYATKNDYLLLGFSPELYTKFYSGSECFSCFPAMRDILNPENILHWLYKEYLSNNDFLLPFDTRESLGWTSDLMVDFSRDIYEIFQDRVLLVKTHFSNFVVAHDKKIKRIQPNCSDDLLFYRQTKILSDPTDHHYAERLSSIIMNKFIHHYKTNINVIRLNDPIFLDPNHKWGLSQFHIDKNSKNKIAKLIHDDLIKKIGNNFNVEYKF